MTKKKYKIGTCFWCQKCLYCGIDLIKETCECKKTVKPTRTNWTARVKNTFPSVFNSDGSLDFKQLDYIKNKNECFQYGYDLTKSIQLSFCSACNSSYQRLTKKSNNSSQKLHTSKYVSQSAEETGIIDLEATSSEISHKTTTSSASIFHNGSKHSSNSETDEDNTELEIEINYKLFLLGI